MGHIRENTDVKIISIKYEITQELKQRLRNLGTEQDQDPSILKGIIYDSEIICVTKWRRMFSTNLRMIVERLSYLNN